MSSEAVLTQILAQLEKLQVQQQQMQSKLENLTKAEARPSSPDAVPEIATSVSPPTQSLLSSVFKGQAEKKIDNEALKEAKEREKVLYPGRVLLTTYPDQHSHTPFTMNWLAKEPSERGPVICSRLPGSIKKRNAIGAHSGSYSIYRALSIAMGGLNPTYKPDYTMTEPPVDIPPNDTWGTDKIVAFDPWGHLTTSVFTKESQEGLDIRPSIAITKAHIKLSEIDESARKGEIVVDGKIVLQSPPLRNEDGSERVGAFSGVEMNVSKAAVEPVWYLPGVADRFGISESLLRRALFEDTGGMYPELITRPDIKVFLPPIGGLTVYIFGNPEYLQDESKELTLRVHDECNGSDVFGSDICTCKPYLVYAIEECVRGAQKGGVGVVVYFRKEGRALGEVTKYLVYNLRKRGGDSADKYFKSTEMVAGVKDMRFQALMPDVLHWLGIKKVHHMVSMSDMKYNAIVNSGIPILRRYDIPDHLIPPDSRVEIDAKIAAGYFSSGKQVTEGDLKATVGRAWEEVEH
ncbi:cyclohydrolase [Flagelloscypha sp. PMI_526]|nr:cyclohydrolase [Flagelloscypha sp. PMI_526]